MSYQIQRGVSAVLRMTLPSAGERIEVVLAVVIDARGWGPPFATSELVWAKTRVEQRITTRAMNNNAMRCLPRVMCSPSEDDVLVTFAARRILPGS